jgi:hypothetical protein
MFSSSRSSLRVPGMGTIHGCRASNQARATWAGVAPFRVATRRSRSTSAWFAALASGLNRGMVVRMSASSNAVRWLICPVRKPLPSGL